MVLLLLLLLVLLLFSFFLLQSFAASSSAKVGGSLLLASFLTTFCKASSSASRAQAYHSQAVLGGGMLGEKLAGLPLKSKMLKKGFRSQASSGVLSVRSWSRPILR